MNKKSKKLVNKILSVALSFMTISGTAFIAPSCKVAAVNSELIRKLCKDGRDLEAELAGASFEKCYAKLKSMMSEWRRVKTLNMTVSSVCYLTHIYYVLNKCYNTFIGKCRIFYGSGNREEVVKIAHEVFIEFRVFMHCMYLVTKNPIYLEFYQQSLRNTTDISQDVPDFIKGNSFLMAFVGEKGCQDIISEADKSNLRIEQSRIADRMKKINRDLVLKFDKSDDPGINCCSMGESEQFLLSAHYVVDRLVDIFDEWLVSCDKFLSGDISQSGQSRVGFPRDFCRDYSRLHTKNESFDRSSRCHKKQSFMQKQRDEWQKKSEMEYKLEKARLTKTESERKPGVRVVDFSSFFQCKPAYSDDHQKFMELAHDKREEEELLKERERKRELRELYASDSVSDCGKTKDKDKDKELIFDEKLKKGTERGVQAANAGKFSTEQFMKFCSEGAKKDFEGMSEGLQSSACKSLHNIQENMIRNKMFKARCLHIDSDDVKRCLNGRLPKEGNYRLFEAKLNDKERMFFILNDGDEITVAPGDMEDGEDIIKTDGFKRIQVIKLGRRS